MVCKFCKSENEDSARICTYCGAALETQAEREEKQKMKEEQEFEERMGLYKNHAEQEKRKKHSKLQWVFGVLLVLAGFGGFIGGNILTGLFFIIAGTLLLPPIIERTPMIKTWMRGVAIGVLLVIGSMLMPQSEDVKTVNADETAATTIQPTEEPEVAEMPAPEPTADSEISPETTIGAVVEPESEASSLGEKSLGVSFDDFKANFRSIAKATGSGFRVGELEKDGEFGTASINKNIAYSIVFDENDDMSFIILIGFGDGTTESGADILLAQVFTMQSFDSSLTAEDVYKILLDCGLESGGGGEVERNGLKYSLTLSDTVGAWLYISKA